MKTKLSTKTPRPSKIYPELYEKLAEANWLIFKLHDLLSQSEIAKVLGVKRQSVQSKVKKFDNK